MEKIIRNALESINLFVRKIFLLLQGLLVKKEA
jgi:hypothetical protein